MYVRTLQELTRLNTEAALVCALSKVEEFMSGDSCMAPTLWLDELSPLVIRLKRCVEVMCTRAKSSLSFLTLHVRTCTSAFCQVHRRSFFK